MPIVNGIPAEPGCYVEGHWGQYGPDHLADQAEAFGWTPAEDGHDDPRRLRRAANWNEDHGYEDIAAEMWERYHWATDALEAWLNDHTASECGTCSVEVIWHDDANAPPAEWVHAPEHLERACGDPQPRHYVWHWRDGEFFLSPICDDPEECNDDTCAHWD